MDLDLPSVRALSCVQVNLCYLLTTHQLKYQIFFIFYVDFQLPANIIIQGIKGYVRYVSSDGLAMSGKWQTIHVKDDVTWMDCLLFIIQMILCHHLMDYPL
jgi:hypothetical protein